MDMKSKIKTFKEICYICSKLQKQGKKVVFVHGFFDIMHKGHILLFNEAKKFSDILVIGVDSKRNSSVLKRSRKIMNSDKERAYVVANIIPVDYCFIMPSMSSKEVPNKNKPQFYTEIYKRLEPNVVASCLTSDKEGGLLRKEQAKSAGIKFVDIKLKFKISTSKIIDFFGFS